MEKFGYNLERIVNSTRHLSEIRKDDMQFGDQIIVSTKNSTYSIRFLDDKFYLVSGGWFDRKGLSPMKTTITGCTWGGSIIKLDIIAACGLCLEFGNRVVTTAITKVTIIRNSLQN